MRYLLSINGKKPVSDREHIHYVPLYTKICINSVLENLGYNVKMNNLTKTLTAEKGNAKLVIKRKKSIIYDNDKVEKIALDTEFYNKSMYVDYAELPMILPCETSEIYERQIISVITSHEETYSRYIEFVKQKGKYENGIYSVTTKADSLLSRGTISLCYIEENDTLRVVYSKNYGVTVTTTIDMFGIYSAYKWNYNAPYETHPHYAKGEFRPDQEGSKKKTLEFLDVGVSDIMDKHSFVKMVNDEIYFLKGDLDSLFKEYNSLLCSQYLLG